MKNKYTILFIISFFLFFFLIFFINLFFFNSNIDKEYEDTVDSYDEKSTLNTADFVDGDFSDIEKKIDQNEDIKKRYNEILSEYKNNIVKKEAEDLNKTIIKFIFSPENLETLLAKESKLSPITLFLYSKAISNNSLDLGISFFKNSDGIRGKYKNKTINLHGVLDLSKDEIVAVFIHELGHYFDVDFFKKGSFEEDKSENFYKISWQSTKVILAGQKVQDFVSGYAMTNKYEDFAESFIYYILHNGDFLKKSQNSEILKKKYDFFGEYLFKNQEFKNTNFSMSDKIEDYYRDITKINYFLEKLLNYLENGI